MIWQQTCSVGHLHTLLNLEVLFLAQACDPAGQHAAVRPEELTEQQDVLVAVFVLQVPPADGALARGVRGIWTFLGSPCDTAFDYGRLPFLDLHHYRDKGEKLGQPFNKEQGVSNNSSNATHAEKWSLQSALSHGPHVEEKACRVHLQVPRLYALEAGWGQARMPK